MESHLNEAEQLEAVEAYESEMRGGPPHFSNLGGGMASGSVDNSGGIDVGKIAPTVYNINVEQQSPTHQNAREMTPQEHQYIASILGEAAAEGPSRLVINGNAANGEW